MSHNLVINFTFNSPEIRILGPIKEQTIDKLNAVIPDATTSSRSTRAVTPQFQYLSNPNHWYIKLDGQTCDEDGISHIMVLVLDALEEEGVWNLISSISSTSSSGIGPMDFKQTHVFFFSKLVDDI